MRWILPRKKKSVKHESPDKTSRLVIFFFMEPAKGLEPSTCALRMRCSTNWAKPANQFNALIYITLIVTCQEKFLANVNGVDDFIAAFAENLFYIVETFGTFVEAHNQFITIVFMATRYEAVDIDTVVRENFGYLRHDTDFIINFQSQTSFAAD